VDAGQLVQRCVTTRGHLEARDQAGGAQEVHRRRYARLVLGMGQRVVAQEEVVVVQRNGQKPPPVTVDAISIRCTDASSP
jgi:hypothetical protein